MTHVINRGYEELGVDLLEPHPANFNRGDRAAINESIGVNGFYGACIVRELPSGVYQILAGEHRWREAKEHGLQRVPCIVVDAEDDEAALRIMAGDNQTNRRGADDVAKRAAVLSALEDLAGTGFDLGDLQELEEGREADEGLEEGNDEPAAEKQKPPPDEQEFARQYGVLIVCSDESEQEATYNALTGSYPVSRLKVVSI